MPIYDDDLFKLDDESRKIAKSMGEDPAQKLSQIEVLRTWIMSHKYLECRTDDKFLLKFLRVAKFSCEAAKERITKYCIARSSKLDGLPEWFSDLDIRDPKIREILETGVVYYMPRFDNLGRIILVFEVEKLKEFKADPVDVIRAVYLIFHYIIFKFERAQIHGVVFIESAGSFDMDMLSYWTPEKMKKSVQFWQGAFPSRVKRVEYYNMHPLLKPFVEAAIAIMKPKMRERVKFHSDHKPADDVPVECMPKCLDGTGPAFHELKDELFRQLEDFQSEMDSLKMCKVDDEKMPKHYEEGDSWGISGSYRTIQPE